jgi:hypothetical protein
VPDTNSLAFVPGVSVANHSLLQRHDFGESLEDLTEGWETWLHHIPFDADVARALLALHRKRAAQLDAGQDAAARQRLERKLQLARSRADRYEKAAFLR